MKDDIQDKEKKRKGLVAKLFNLRSQIKTEADQREHIEEVRSLEAAIEQTDREIEEAQVEVAKAKISEFGKEALALQTQRKSLLAEIEKVDEKFFKILSLAEEAIPKKRVQVSSKQFVTLTRTVQMPKLVWNPFGPPTVEFSPKIEEDIIAAIPSHLERFLAEGWSLKETVQPEELTPENSKEIPCFHLPEIFSDYDLGDRWVLDAYHQGLLR